MSRIRIYFSVISLFLLLISINSCFSNKSFAQTSIDTTAVWRVNYVTDNGTNGCYFTHDNYKYFIKGDTLIN
ncbi:MAG: hypothetical protein J7J86_05270, partial [Bacteroidales bacterium]|nr:hypothetical protein [Bacteroidales bacterium]